MWRWELELSVAEEDNKQGKADRLDEWGMWQIVPSGRDWIRKLNNGKARVNQQDEEAAAAC